MQNVKGCDIILLIGLKYKKGGKIEEILKFCVSEY